MLLFYNAQGYLYPQGTIVSQSALLLIFAISGFYFIKTMLLKHKEQLVKAWSFFYLLNLIGYFYTGDYTNALHFGMLQGITSTLLIFYPFYYTARVVELSESYLIWLSLLILPLFILQFFYVNEVQTYILDSDSVVNNIGYRLVSLIPFVFLIRRNKIVSTLFMLVLMYFIISSSKRGALISGAIGWLLLIYTQLRTVDSNNKFKTYVIIFIVISVFIFFAYYTYSTNELLLQRIEDMRQGESSGRDIIFNNIFNAWYRSDSLFNFFFGFGFASSLRLSGTGNFAHNDILEMLSNFGLLGVLSYLFIFYAGLKILMNPIWNKDKKLLMFLTLAIWISNSLTTPGYNSNDNIGLTIIIAFLIGTRNTSLSQQPHALIGRS